MNEYLVTPLRWIVRYDATLGLESLSNLLESGLCVGIAVLPFVVRVHRVAPCSSSLGHTAVWQSELQCVQQTISVRVRRVVLHSLVDELHSPAHDALHPLLFLLVVIYV